MSTPPNLGRATPLSQSTGPAASTATVPVVSTTPPLPGLPEVRIPAEKDRLRKCILALATQVKNRSIVDGFLSCLNPGTAIDGRTPFTAKSVVTIQDRQMLLHNLMAHAVLAWGRLARGETTEANPHLAELERIIGTIDVSGVTGKSIRGFHAFFAFPKDKNSVIYVLRTESEERKIRKDRAAAAERALEAKTRILEGGRGKDESVRDEKTGQQDVVE